MNKLLTTLENFIKDFVDLTTQENGDFGHFPFQFFTVTKDNKLEIGALALGGDVISCFKYFSLAVIQDAKQVFMSLDYPGNEHIPQDFVAVFYYHKKRIDVVAIPYDTATGKRSPIVYRSPILDDIKQTLKDVLNGKIK